ncbi:unnamed protein product, partial [Protopolystoma xenopodis]
MFPFLCWDGEKEGLLQLDFDLPGDVQLIARLEAIITPVEDLAASIKTSDKLDVMSARTRRLPRRCNHRHWRYCHSRCLCRRSCNGKRWSETLKKQGFTKLAACYATSQARVREARKHSGRSTWRQVGGLTKNSIRRRLNVRDPSEVVARPTNPIVTRYPPGPFLDPTLPTRRRLSSRPFRKPQVICPGNRRIYKRWYKLATQKRPKGRALSLAQLNSRAAKWAASETNSCASLFKQTRVSQSCPSFTGKYSPWGDAKSSPNRIRSSSLSSSSRSSSLSSSSFSSSSSFPFSS